MNFLNAVSRLTFRFVVTPLAAPLQPSLTTLHHSRGKRPLSSPNTRGENFPKLYQLFINKLKITANTKYKINEPIPTAIADTYFTTGFALERKIIRLIEIAPKPTPPPIAPPTKTSNPGKPTKIHSYQASFLSFCTFFHAFSENYRMYHFLGNLHKPK